ncbi:TetR family transcriptional regulator [endosymbiont of Acanthamoeba sp. UWC8]|nr:TetR/AcrR family transcriptional regulator [Candidatus Jidaibacter acanthamoeba]AIF81251.1 TetR family transcriptional regulator [endosymbiont of Acanthamoeba sp. UWC8]
MARRSDHTRDELTKLILDSAFNLVSKSGYTQVSTRKIAAEIGYTVGTLYNVFTNLDDIFIHVNARIIDMLLNRLKAVIDQEAVPEKSIYLLAEEYLKFSREDYNLWNILFEYRFSNKQILPNWYTNKIAELFDLLEGVISDIASNKTSDIKSTTAIIWAGIHGICSLGTKGKLARIKLDNPEVLVKQFINGVIANLN